MSPDHISSATICVVRPHLFSLKPEIDSFTSGLNLPSEGQVSQLVSI